MKSRRLFSIPAFCFLLACSPRTAIEHPGPKFREAAAETGLRFQHFTGATGQFYLPEIMGSGVALLDYDGDGDLDVFLVQGTVLEPGKSVSDARFPPPAGWKPGNRLFRNMLKETGKLQFVDVTDQAGLNHVDYDVGYGMGVAVGDYNNDGYPDLFVTNFGSNILYRNNGNGTFTDVTREAGLADAGWSASAAFVDYDRDGYLDLYVTHYLDFTVRGNRECFDPAGERDYCPPSAYKPVLHRLYRNMGNGKFQDVTQAAGIDAAVGPGLGVICADFNGDGWPDIYAANDGAANLLWLNNGNGAFREAALLSGAAYSEDGVARAGMGVTAGDFDETGNESIFVTNLTREGAGLFRNKGHAEFTDATREFGLYQPTFPYTGFGVHWFDYDNDGRPDLYIANGAVTIVESLRGTPYPYHQKNLLLHNEGARFRETSGEAGPAFQLSEVARGAAFGDIDNDGRIDIVVANNNGPARLLLNETTPKGHWLEIRLQGVKCNRDGIGARVAVLREGQKPLWGRAHTDGSYLSASDVRVHFGLGQNPKAQVLVEWPDGSKEKWDQVRADSLIILRQGTGKPP
ncbi:MAG TPA: CRTAC1 family protein [Bryobacteraceae bacterium]|nr:CRTAC1 family protein [Bryobacteraceae bacterium]